jgi:hypothetical protein
MERYCSKGQSPQQAGTPKEEKEEFTSLNVIYRMSQEECAKLQESVP